MILEFRYKLILRVFLLIAAWNLGTGNSFAQQCSIIYVTPSGASSGSAGSISTPASLPYAFTLASAANNRLWLAAGNYTISNELIMISGISMEGGFDPVTWKKSNSLHTVIYRDSTHVDTVPNRIVAVECSGISNFSIHDITIIVNDARGNSVSTYGIHLAKCSSYDISRLNVTSGNATDGFAGVAGANGVNGANGVQGQPGDDGGGCCTLGGAGGTGSYPGSNSGGNGGDGGARGTGQCFGFGGTSPDGAVGQTGLGVNGGAGGVGGQGAFYYVGSLLGCSGTPANDGRPGADGANGAMSANGANGIIVYGRYFLPGDGQIGIQGVHGGGGGGGGGGGAKGGVSTCFGDFNGAGAGGSGGGEGGQGGFGATGGKGGGGSFGIYIDSNGVNSSLKDCLLNSGLQGIGGIGGTPGGVGGNGGFGAGLRPGCSMGGGGASGAGGAGGKGGDGGNGVAGVSLPLFEDPAGVTIAQSDMRSTVEPAIYVKNTGCTYSKITYTTNATGIIQWFFDGGSYPLSANGDSAQTQYSIGGRHSITLVVDGVPYMFTDFTGVFKDGTPYLPRVVGSDTVCPGSSATYTAAFDSVFTVTAYKWNIYNPGSSTPAQSGTSAAFTYLFPNTVGVYMITLQTESPCCGWSAIDTSYINVVPFLPADVYVSTSAAVICHGEPSTFFAVPVNGGSHPGYNWKVNGVSNGINQSSFTSTSFNNGDIITCAMTSSYACPLNSPAVSLPFVMTVNPLPAIACSAAPLYLGAHTGFNANFTGGTAPYRYTWNFGDGGIDTNAVGTHLYGGTGPYTYTVAVTDSKGCTGFCTNTVVIFLAPAIHPDFTFTPNYHCGGTSVTFTDMTTGNPTLWNWNFGDGSPSSTLQNPTHNYTVPGNYNVKFTAGNSIFTDTLYRPNLVSVWAVPTAHISYLSDSTCYPLPEQFEDISVHAASWLWNFGDGGPSSTLQNPSHPYHAVGTYPITLIVHSIEGCADTTHGTVYVMPSPKAAFSQNKTAICNGQTVLFTNSSSIDAVKWDWKFGDGTVYTGNGPPEHVFANAGVYNVSLAVVNSFGCKDDTVVLNSVTVKNQPAALFSLGNSETIFFGTPVSLVNSSSYYTSWIWNYGNGKIDSTDFNTSVEYKNPGIYNVTLYAIYRGLGMTCIDSMSMNVTINDFESLYIPNAFTPNGDNDNDVFYVYANDITDFQLYIFNRWGNLIFETNDLKKGWDGKVKGDKSPDGVYTYRVVYKKKTTPNDSHTRIGSLLLLGED